MANGTTELFDDIYSKTYILVESVIGISAILGNILVIWAVRVNPGLQNTTYYFIVSLAVADLAVGILVVPLSIIISLDMVSQFYTCLFICCILIILTNASILSLLAIAVDRYLRIKIPTRYRTVTTPRRIYLSIWIIWIVSLLVGLVPMFGWNNRSYLKKEHQDYLSCSFTSVMSMEYMVYFNIFLWVFLPLGMMLILYIEIFYLIRKQLKLNTSKSTGRGVFYGKEYKTAKSLVLVLLLFALCWLPLSILDCMLYFDPNFANVKSTQYAILFAILLSHANSLMNPIIYAFKIQKFKDTYIKIIKSYILHRAMASDGGSGEHTLEEISQD